ncbi:hypothetical protein NQZ79_g415 [Umbelopsis isabellina]|nr:hypothetical protein NQZ79_g415 [Umbelopsis isabellina]
MEVMTSQGIRSLSITRSISPSDPGMQVSDLVTKFIKTIPLVLIPQEGELGAAFKKLVSTKRLKTLGIKDVLKELESRPLNNEEMIACMKWWIKLQENRQAGWDAETKMLLNSPQTRAEFLAKALLQHNDVKLMQLASIKHYVNQKFLPIDMPLPESVLPFEISCKFQQAALTSHFGWTQLQLLEWVQYVSTKPELESSPAFAQKVLSVVSRNLNVPQMVSTHQPSEIAGLLKEKRCIPTKQGMRFPHEAYFPTVKLFDDLPVVLLDNPRAVSEPTLLLLGVRKHVDLQMIFDRLVSQGSWSHLELVKYLASVEDTISSKEIARVKETAIFPKAETSNISEKEKEGSKVVPKRYKAYELYAPLEELEPLNLPTIQWDGKWRASSPQAQFLEKLGLRNYPSLTDILRLASDQSNSQEQRNQSLKFLVDHFDKYYEKDYHVERILQPIVPCQDGQYANPRDCYVNPECAILGFKVIVDEMKMFRDKLGISEDPNAPQLLTAFKKHITKDQALARRIFEYMASRISLGQSVWNQLQTLEFIPVRDSRAMSKEAKSITMMRPTECYFVSKDKEQDFHQELFVFIDFGDVANTFLRCCGVKNEPTIVELSQMMVRDPQLYWKLSGGGENYLNVLRRIANQFYQIKSNVSLISQMKRAKILIGYRQKDAEDDKVGENITSVVACRVSAQEVYINDDATGFHMFSPICAPTEPVLEELYKELGCIKLSSQIKEHTSCSGKPVISEKALSIQSRILERIPIILYQVFVDAPQRKSELRLSQEKALQKLKVVEVSEIMVTRVFVPTGQQDVQRTTACADIRNVTMNISNTKEVDYYDVASSLCHLLFKRIGFNDAIIFERYLVATLSNLRSRGVPVDRVLHNLKVSQQPEANSQDTNQQTHKSADVASDANGMVSQVQAVFPDCDPKYIHSELQKEKENHVENVVNRLLNTQYPKKSSRRRSSSIGIKGSNHDKNDRVETIPEQKPQNEKGRGDKNVFTNLFNKYTQQSHQLLDNIKSPNTPKAVKPSRQTPVINDVQSRQENIKRDLLQAVRQCQPNSAKNVFSPPTAQTVAEYCDATPSQNLKFIEKANGYEFYVHNDVDGQFVLKQFGEQLKHFSEIIRTLSGVFGVNEVAIHMFYDPNGNAIAFYRNGSLFFNLRFYLSLHDHTSGRLSDREKQTKIRDAMKFWYLTMCHELAHYFQDTHNAQHEVGLRDRVLDDLKL